MPRPLPQDADAMVFGKSSQATVISSQGCSQTEQSPGSPGKVCLEEEGLDRKAAGAGVPAEGTSMNKGRKKGIWAMGFWRAYPDSWINSHGIAFYVGTSSWWKHKEVAQGSWTAVGRPDLISPPPHAHT